MKTIKLVIALALGASAWTVQSQTVFLGGGQPPQAPLGVQAPVPPRAPHPPPPPHLPSPVMGVLDADHNGALDAKEIANASAALLQLDQNADGQLAAEELRAALPAGARPPAHQGAAGPRRLPPPGPLMAALDANQDGALSADEIAKAPAALLTLDRNQDGQLTPDELRQPHRVPPVFAALDANHDGVIDAAEMDNAPAVLKTLDANNDGRLTLDELMPPPPINMPADGQGPPHSLRPPRPAVPASVPPQRRPAR